MNNPEHNPLPEDLEGRLRGSLRAESGALTHRFETGLSGGTAAPTPTPQGRTWGRLLLPIAVGLALLAGGGAAAVTAFSDDESQPIEVAVPPTAVPPTAVPATTEPLIVPSPTPENWDGVFRPTTPDPAREPLPEPSALPTAAPTPTGEPPAAPAPPVPTPDIPPITSTECTPEQRPQIRKMDVVNVEPGDPDGGLVVHSAPSVAAPETGVLPWNAKIVLERPGCAVLDSGAVWWEVYAGSTSGWVNSAYLGQKMVGADALAVTPCDRTSTDALGVIRTTTFAPPLAVHRVDVESTAACDRVVVHFAENVKIGSIVTELAVQPDPLTVGDLILSDSWLEIPLPESFAPALELNLLPVEWTDEATGESNVAFVADRPSSEDGALASYVHVGWGSGEAAVRFANNPARIIIDIFQTPTAPGQLAGPITSNITSITAPLQSDLTGPGIELPLTIRGFSRGFESTTQVYLEHWPEDDPTWYAGRDGFGGVEAELSGPGVNNYGAGQWFFTTRDGFELTLDGLPPGSYALSLSPFTGRLGQTFRVLDPDAPILDGAPAQIVRTSADENGNCTAGCGSDG